MLINIVGTADLDVRIDGMGKYLQIQIVTPSEKICGYGVNAL